MLDVKRTCAECQICAELKPTFFKPKPGQLINSRAPFERLSIDFVDPKSYTNANKYLIVIIDEYSRYPLAYPYQDILTRTVISCLQNLFSLFGCPDSIHSDRGAQFVSTKLKEFLWKHGITITHSTSYHPVCNSQCERVNGTIWKAVQLALRTQELDNRYWQTVLDMALHSIRSLLCTSMSNSTPDERLFKFHRGSGIGYTLPDCLQGGPALLQKFVHQSKSNPLVEAVEILLATPNFARIRFPDGILSTVSTGDLAPPPQVESQYSTPPDTLTANNSANPPSPAKTNTESIPACPKESSDLPGSTYRTEESSTMTTEEFLPKTDQSNSQNDPPEIPTKDNKERAGDHRHQGVPVKQNMLPRVL